MFIAAALYLLANFGVVVAPPAAINLLAAGAVVSSANSYNEGVDDTEEYYRARRP